MLERDRGEDGVADQRAGGLADAHKAAWYVPVSLAEDAGSGLGEPGRDRRVGLGGGKRPVENAGICCSSQEGPQRQSGDADKVRPREHLFEPGSAFLVLLRSWMVGMEQQVRIDEDHR
jgi:hypothetical protein